MKLDPFYLLGVYGVTGVAAVDRNPAYARAHGLTLIEAKDAMARDRWKAAQGRLAAVRRCGRAITPMPAPTPTSDPAGANQHADAPWMMKD